MHSESVFSQSPCMDEGCPMRNSR